MRSAKAAALRQIRGDTSEVESSDTTSDDEAACATSDNETSAATSSTVDSDTPRWRRNMRPLLPPPNCVKRTLNNTSFIDELLSPYEYFSMILDSSMIEHITYHADKPLLSSTV